MEEPQKSPSTRPIYTSQQQSRSKDNDQSNESVEGSRRMSLDRSLDDIEEEGSEEFVEASDAVVMVVQDHVTRAEQRKEDYVHRSAEVQKRLDDLAARRLRNELNKKDIR